MKHKNKVRKGETVGFALLAMSVLAQPAVAAEKPARGGVCTGDTLPAQPFAGPKNVPVSQLPVQIDANQVESTKEDKSIFTGKAQLRRGGDSIFGDKLTYYKPQGDIEAQGNVVLRNPAGDTVETSHLRINLDTEVGTSDAAKFELADRTRKPAEKDKIFLSSRGDAKRIFFEGHDLMRLEDARYTTCARGQDDVVLVAREIKLDQTTGVGTARDMKIRFMDVPIFYFPYMTFPISNERKSGFLYPSFGVSGKSGTLLAVPYYWNIAPNYDATITPRVMGRRGLQLEGEFRYLQKDYAGIVHGEVLPSDDEYNNKDRGTFTFKHNQRFDQRWTADVDYQWASDKDYFDDFYPALGLSAQTHLPQEAKVGYRGDIWNFSGRASAYQTIDQNIAAGDRPYNRLPQLRLDAPQLFDTAGGLKFGFESELVRFDRSTGVTGTRVDLHPVMSMPINKIYGYVKPRVDVRHTSYNLDDVATGNPETPSRSIPTFSVDSGLFFERDTSWGGESHIQTLEPRLFYVYTPYKNQDNLPNFDSGETDISYGSLFRINRFTGADRIADANQMVLGVTSRFLDKVGREWARASIGQAYYFSDRKVNISPGVITRSTSDIVADASTRLAEHWSVGGALRWNPDSEKNEEGKFDLSYKLADNKRLDLGYRYNRSANTEQVDLWALWPLGARWHFRGHYAYSLAAEQTLESAAGLEYNACCWALRMTAQRRVDDQSQYRNALLLELELTGLTKIKSGF